MSTDTATEPTANVMSHEECVCGSEKYCPRATARMQDTAQSSTTSDDSQLQQQLVGKNSCRFARQLTASAEPLPNHEMHINKPQRLVQQRSILKNSIDRQQEENDILEAKKQLILRRRRMFSHYRQYEQWRRRQFSYDPCYLVNLTPKSHSGGYGSYGLDMSGVGVGGGFGGNRAAAGRRRRQYRRQFSCAEENENLLDNNERNERNEEDNDNFTNNNNNMKIYHSPAMNLHSEPVSVSS